MSLKEAEKQILPLLLVLGIVIVGWEALAKYHSAPETKLDKASEWAKELIGLAVALAGFLGIGAASLRLGEASSRQVEGGALGILAGATLLGVGGWGAPVALAVLVTGVTTVRVARALSDHPRSGSESESAESGARAHV